MGDWGETVEYVCAVCGERLTLPAFVRDFTDVTGKTSARIYVDHEPFNDHMREHPRPPEGEVEVVDLVAALRASVEAAKARRIAAERDRMQS